MSYNGSGTFNINSTGQPVVAGTVITASAFNALTTDLATGLTTAITKDGQTTTTARITFAQGITSSLTTDSSSVSTGSIITDGGVGIAKNLYVGGALNVTGATSFTNPVINNIKMGYTTTATAAGTTTLTVASNYRQFFTGTTTQTIVLPVTSTLVTGIAYEIENNSTGLLTVNSSGGNLVGTVPAGVCAHAVCIGTTLTTAADWDWDYISTTTITGTGANVLGTSPTITTPTISSLSSAAATALTLQSAGTTAITVDTSQNVGIGTATPSSFYSEARNLVVGTGTGGQGISIYAGSASQSRLMFADGTSGSDAYTGFVQYSHADNALQFGTNGGTERMRINSSGNLLLGTTTNVGLLTMIQTTTEGNSMHYVSGAGADYTLNSMNSGGQNAAAAGIKMGKNSSTSRSINAGGTINASGADYAEYMVKAGSFTVAKGDVVGINAQGKLTNVFADAIAFVVKSTDPSYVGGDVWGNEDAIGLTYPKYLADDATDAEKSKYASDKTAFETALEVARQTVDRIAFSGQVPVNVTGATAGQYIIPVNDNGAIKGQAVTSPTFEQYQIAVGKVIAIESDGRAKIIVKVA